MFEVKTIRAVCIAGKRVEPGTTLQVDATAAHSLLANLKALPADGTDPALVAEAVHREAGRLARQQTSYMGVQRV